LPHQQEVHLIMSPSDVQPSDSSMSKVR